MSDDDAAEMRRFLNRLKIMRSIDGHDMFDVDVEQAEQEWPKFARNPFLWLMAASDADAAKVWSIIRSREQGRQT